jgi:pimeloyl-ACP methyl ester carboxylesterase
MNKTVRIISKAFLVVVAIVIGLLAISTISNLIITCAEKNQYTAPGKLVTVRGHKMHVYSKGTGEKKIVLLSGFGSSSPVLDFKYLMEKLSTDYTVIVVEYFGYGWSDKTDAPRTTANIVEETREALRAAGFKPPYILMPHSLSGIYTLYYANTHPEEVEAIVGLDSSVPAQFLFWVYDKRRVQGIYPPNFPNPRVLEFLRISGLGRIGLQLAHMLKIESLSNADTEVKNTMILWNYVNPDLIDESHRMYQNSKVVKKMKIPSTIPAAFILADRTEKESGMINGAGWKKMHELQVIGNVYGKVVVLPGAHNIHHYQVDNIKTIVDEVVKTEMR